MRLLYTSLVISLSVVLSIRAAPLIGDPIDETTVTDTPELILSSPISTFPDSTVGAINPALLIDLLPNKHPTSTASPVIISQYNNAEDGNYEYGYKTSNGIEVEEKGTQKEFIGEDGEKVYGTVSSGKYSYIIVDADGERKKMTVTWTADENGFRPIITYSDDCETTDDP